MKPKFTLIIIVITLFCSNLAQARNTVVVESSDPKQLSKQEPTSASRHVSNPYSGADRYINHDYSREIEYSIKHANNPKLAAKMRRLQFIPTSIWLDRIDAITGGEKNNYRLSLERHLIQALRQQRKGIPMVVELVLYNLPNRDCSALSSNGTLDFRSNGLNTYKTEYIDTIATLINDPRFASLRIVNILEPDSLPNMITNLWNKRCELVHKNHIYEQGIGYAIEQLGNRTNSYIYMDIGHSGWLGWEKTLQKTVQYFTKVVEGSNNPAGLAAIDGFITNISGSTPTEEIFLTNPNQIIDGKPVKSAAFFSWNAQFDEKRYIESLYKAFTAEGFSENIKFLIDTSRNGWGGKLRPQTISTAFTVNDYVEQSRLDRRFHRGNWCNPSGAGLGERPASEPYGADHPIAAFIWVKPPGESDGTSDPSQTEADSEGKRYDKMCDPNYIVDYGPNPSRKPTGALPDAPASGHWFHTQFSMLINNAHPPINIMQ